MALAGMTARTRSKRPLALQLTSLLDMFTIILVFLMVSFQSEDKDFVLNSDVTLPASSAEGSFKTAVSVAVTTDEVLVEGRPVVSLGQGEAWSERLEEGGLAELTEAVDAAWRDTDREADEEQVVVIQADESLPYQTISLVMRSAAEAGFFRYRLVVEKS